MTKDRLRNLSYKELLSLAEKDDIYVQPDMEKEDLVSLILDAMEEERLEREENNNLTIQVENKKYEVTREEELFPDFGDNIELPRRYNVTKLMLMLRDPSWVYCYWDIENRILDEIKSLPDFNGFVLRVTELAAPDWGMDSAVDWFDIPLNFEDFDRYINLPNEDAFFGSEIYALIGEDEKLIVRSNIIESSRNYFAPMPGNENPSRDRLIEISGFSTDEKTFSSLDSEDNSNPQRIISGSEE